MPGVQIQGGQSPHRGHDAHTNCVVVAQDLRVHGAQGSKELALDVDEQVRYESFILDADEKHVEVDPETREYRTAASTRRSLC